MVDYLFSIAPAKLNPTSAETYFCITRWPDLPFCAAVFISNRLLMNTQYILTQSLLSKKHRFHPAVLLLYIGWRLSKQLKCICPNLFFSTISNWLILYLNLTVFSTAQLKCSLLFALQNALLYLAVLVHTIHKINTLILTIKFALVHQTQYYRLARISESSPSSLTIIDTIFTGVGCRFTFNFSDYCFIFSKLIQI